MNEGVMNGLREPLCQLKAGGLIVFLPKKSMFLIHLTTNDETFVTHMRALNTLGISQKLIKQPFAFANVSSGVLGSLLFYVKAHVFKLLVRKSNKSLKGYRTTIKRHKLTWGEQKTSSKRCRTINSKLHKMNIKLFRESVEEIWKVFAWPLRAAACFTPVMSPLKCLTFKFTAQLVYGVKLKDKWAFQMIFLNIILLVPINTFTLWKLNHQKGSDCTACSPHVQKALKHDWSMRAGLQKQSTLIPECCLPYNVIVDWYHFIIWDSRFR